MVPPSGQCDRIARPASIGEACRYHRAVSARVDVILPTFRRPHTIPLAIASVLAQTHAALQLHVVGDGCCDATESAVRAVADPRVSFHRFAKAPGYGYANRNRVLRATDAPFVAYMSDDDLWFPDHLERALVGLSRHGAGLVALSTCVVRPGTGLDPFFFAYDWDAPLARSLRHWFLGAPNVVHRREVLARIGYWREDLLRFGDRELYNRARDSAVVTRLLPDVTLLRFFAQHWDPLYAALPEPPQARYLHELMDPAFVARVREAAAGASRPFATRAQQAGDFARFAARSGPGFLRFAWRQLRRPRA
jgi:glycosyltransferase involved in cell wall biosynthesis